MLFFPRIAMSGDVSAAAKVLSEEEIRQTFPFYNGEVDYYLHNLETRSERELPMLYIDLFYVKNDIYIYGDGVVSAEFKGFSAEYVFQVREITEKDHNHICTELGEMTVKDIINRLKDLQKNLRVTEVKVPFISWPKNSTSTDPTASANRE